MRLAPSVLSKFYVMAWQGASQLIVAHNHPNQDATPSAADIHLTETLKQACQAIDLNLVDHIIVGRNETLSFAETGTHPF